MRFTFVVEGRLPGANDFINAGYRNRFYANNMKAKAEKLVADAIRKYEVPHFDNPVKLGFEWYEPNRRKDCDNVAFAKKFVQDALVRNGVLDDDSRKYVVGYLGEEFPIDKDNPRVVVTITDEFEE